MNRFASRAYSALSALIVVMFCTAAAPSARAAAVTPPPDQPELVDTSASAGGVFASSSSSATYSAGHAFDGNWSDDAGRWLAYTNPDNDYGNGVHGENPMYLVYKFNVPTKVNVLRLRIPSNNSWEKRSPKAWTFSGSNDGSTWTQLDARSGVTWTAGETKTVSFANQTAYEYYKFSCTEIIGENNYMMLHELQFLYVAAVLTDLTTTTSGSVSSSSATHDNYPASKAFDHNRADTNGRWLSTIGDHMYLVYHFNDATAVNAIRVWNGSDSAGGWNSTGRAPKAWTFSGSNDGSTWTELDAQTDETNWAANGEARYYEFRNNTAYEYYKYDCTELNGGTDYLQLWELEFYYLNQGAPAIGATTLARTGASAYSLTATEDTNAADLSYVLASGTTLSTNGTQSVAEGGSATWAISGLVAGKTYRVSVLATNANGTAETVAGTLYTGELALGATTNANEYGLVAGGVVVSRGSAAPFPLTVNYTISGSAGSQGTTWAAPEPVTIPAGSATATLPVVPLLDADVAEDVTITVTLAAGNYEMPAAASATLTLVNLVAPDGYNVWVAPSAGLASVDSNWSKGHTPTASEHVLFDGDFSTAACEWDAAASATVASWTQTNGYTGTVTFDTEFPDYSGATFPLFTISGDCVIASGKWSCRGNYNNYGVSTTPMSTYKTAKRWCLNVAVGGAMTVAEGTAITATGRGYGYANNNTSGNSQSYGGYGWGGSTSPYGSIKEPFDPGMGSRSQSDQNNRIAAIGGGAIKLAVTGNLTLDGSIVALGTADQNIARSGGTGGSIWITANQISGSGKIDASGPTGIGNDQIVSVGSGGRIALYTQSPLAFPIDNVACSGTGYRGTSWQWNSRVSGHGTIYVYDPTQTNGTLYLKQSTDVSTQNSKWTGTPVMGDLALDAVILSGCASLRIPAGTSLTLPSLEAVTTSNTGSGSAGLVYAGGTLNIGNGDQTLKTNVAFSSPTVFSFPGDLTLETGAKLGSLGSIYGTSGAADYDTAFTVSVAGDLTIPADAYAGATRCCALTAGSTGRYTAAHGGQSLYLAAAARTNGFDSVLSPSMPGGSMNNNFPAGGAFTLTVGGTLTLDGSITADGGGARGSTSTYANASAGAGGTVNVTAGALAGEGKISADGGCGKYDYAGGAGGGRVAVRLTGAGSTFSGHWTTNIFARGQSLDSNTAKASSAGTVYMQTAADGEAGGTVVVRNDFAVQAFATNNLATTRYPGNGDGCDAPAALKKTSLVVDGAGRVELTDSLKIAALSIDSGSSIDLAGTTLTVKRAKFGETKLSPGTYTTADAALADFVTDSGEGGSLVVSGGGFSLVVR